MAEETDKTPTQRRERRPAQYELVKEEPRASSNSASSTRLYEELEKVQQDPGEWYRVVTCNSRSGANGIKTNIEKGTRKVPAGSYEFTTRTNYPEDGQSALFARYMNDEDGD